MKWLVATALLVGTATAAPKRPDAKAAFDKGVAAYTKGDYAAAATQLGKSYGLEPDVETLFAWAQSERKLEHCEKATTLYAKLLDAELPAANKAVVRQKFDECQKILAAQAPPIEPDVVASVAAPEPAPPPPPPREAGRAWWANPVGGALVLGGLVSAGAGTVFLVQGHAANQDKANAVTYGEFQRLEDRAESRGTLGTALVIAGGALVAGGVVWYATHPPAKRGAQIAGWAAPDGGGVVAFGRF